MPKYLVEDSKTGRSFELEGDSPPTDQELEEIFASQAPAGASETTAPEHPLAKLGNSVVEGGKGALKGLGEFAQGAGKLMNRVVPTVGALSGGDVAGAYDAAVGNTPGLADAIMPGAIDQKLPELQAENDAQKVGKVGSQLGLALASGGGGALSQAARAAIMSAAQSGKIDGNTALAALTAGGMSAAGKGLSSGADLLKKIAGAKAVAAAEAASASGGKELLGAAVGAYEGRRGGVGGMAGGAAAGAYAGKKSDVLAKLVSSPQGQRFLASILGKMGSGAQTLAPVGGAGAAALGRALDSLRRGTVSTEYARN